LLACLNKETVSGFLIKHIEVWNAEISLEKSKPVFFAHAARSPFSVVVAN
jgi:hypothetical protein